MKKQKAIVLRSINHSESSLIVNLVGEHGDSLGLMAKGIKKSKRIQPVSISRPLSLVEIEYYPAKKGSLHLLKSYSDLYAQINMDRRPEVMCFRQFAAEMLLRFASQHPEGSEVFKIGAWAMEQLTLSTDLVEFPINFCNSVISVLGLQPDWHSFSEGDVLDFANGCFIGGVKYQPGQKEGSWGYWKILARESSERALKNGNERWMTLNLMLDYLSYHQPGFQNLKSLEIIRAVLL
ncbi:DNA repair protein RecO [Luteibaculum oceani]|uniref:DNA replication/recombination mediator RecO N-terminal domain-containing protein n=1 Tax=Luteibaculum oceani TaxID=1294296 RepID=A0A5C6VPR4_9FLAO|nr:recombination protein O N-terminal domain-containing protein [Luteibaculum oceani]TXC85308.1 hypothetical protein FRX97_01400 [Luteibaculum oceani]